MLGVGENFSTTDARKNPLETENAAGPGRWMAIRARLPRPGKFINSHAATLLPILPWRATARKRRARAIRFGSFWLSARRFHPVVFLPIFNKHIQS
jgi:hypothetical protein